MLDYLRNLRKSTEEKQQEALNAYLDNELSAKQRLQLEKELAADADLRANLDQLSVLKQEMRQLPRRRVPRNFTLDPALYGRPKREPLIQAYPVLRTATVLTAFIFIFALAANVFWGGISNLAPGASQSAAIEAEPAADIAAAPVEEAVESEAEMALEFQVQPEMTAEEVVVEEAEAPPPSADGEFDDAAAGEMEMPEAALIAPDLSVPSTGQLPLATITSDDLAREAPVVTESVEEEVQLLEPVASPAALATMIAEEPVPLSEAEDEVGRSAPETLAQPQTSEPMLSRPLSSVSLIVFLLGVIFVILLLLTLITRRRLNE